MAKGTYHKRPAGSGVSLSPAGASARVQLGNTYKFVHVYSDADVHIAFGDATVTATADENSLYVKATTPYIFPVNPGEYIAAIGTATVEIHYME